MLVIENFNILNIWKKNFQIVLIKLNNWIRRCLIQSWRNQFKLILQKRFTSKMNIFLYLSKPPTYPLVSRLVKISFRIVLWFFGFVLNFRPPWFTFRWLFNRKGISTISKLGWTPLNAKKFKLLEPYLNPKWAWFTPSWHNMFIFDQNI